MEKEIGSRIKSARIEQGLTLKDLGTRTNLSISYLSLVERGLTSMTITSLQSIATALGEDPSSFMQSTNIDKKTVIRSYEQEVVKMDNSNYIYFSLAGDVPEKVFDPIICILLPTQSKEEIIPLTHEGQEFCYVLEGILTFYIDNREYELYPGDSLHISSSVPHNWENMTNKLVKLLYVITPKVFD